MNDKLDELAKGLAQSVTRRGALKRFGVGLAGVVLAALGLANKAEAAEAGDCYRRCSQPCYRYANPNQRQQCLNRCFNICYPHP